jgi:cyclophilin family peptidyl-prolyl cis-trans isomerase
VEVNPEWAPLGAARFSELVETPGFFEGVRFFRTIKGFMS